MLRRSSMGSQRAWARTRRDRLVCRRQPRHQRWRLFPLAAILAVSALASGRAAAQTITEIIDATGDGAGNGLNGSIPIAVDAAGNVYLGGFNSNNAFKITPAEVIPAVSEWGLIVMGLLLVAGGTICFGRRRVALISP